MEGGGMKNSKKQNLFMKNKNIISGFKNESLIL